MLACLASALASPLIFATMTNSWKRPLSACLLLVSALHVPSCRSVRITPQTFHEHVTVSRDASLARSQRRTLSSLDLPIPNDHLVASLPLLEPGSFPTRQWAGLLPLNQTEDDKYIFYWLLEPDFSDTAGDGLSKDDPAQVPLVIWLNGGPGCSSLEGLMIENGPFRLVFDGDNGWNLKVDPHSWHRIPAWVLYIDQPVGTGFSFTKRGNYCGNDEAVNQDFYAFLQTFLSVYREYFVTKESGSNPVLNRELYFSGESHAGHYIPSMMDYILQMNDIAATQTPPRIRIPLAGAALGNPWTDPFHQYAAADIAYGYGFIDGAQKAHLDELEMTCRQNINEWMEHPSNKQPKHCLELVNTAVRAANGAKSYNVNFWDTEYPPGKKTAENYFRGKLPGSSGINAALNIEGFKSYFGTYSECSNKPYNALFHQDCLGVVNELVRVLDHPSRPHILFYFGMADFVCNHVSGEKMLDALPWDRAPSWALAERYVWKIDTEYPPGKKTAENYFRGKLPGSSGINAALNIEGFKSYFGTYSECSNKPYNALFHQDCLGVVNELVRVLDHPSRPHILFYFGMADFVCNHVSGEKMLDALPWDRAPSWALAERYVWKINNDDGDPAPSGYVKKFENLSLLKIANAGHMVPMEKPAESLEMMRILVGRECFQSASFAQEMEQQYPRQIHLPDRCVDCPDCANIFSEPNVCSPRPILPTSPTSSSSRPSRPEAGEYDQEKGEMGAQTDIQSLTKGKIFGAFAAFAILMAIYAFLTFDHRKIGAVKLATFQGRRNGANAPVYSAEMMYLR